MTYTVLHGKSTALSDEVESKQAELEKNCTQLRELRDEKTVVEAQHDSDVANNSPNEPNSAQELEVFDTHINHTLSTIVEIINWLAD